MMILVRLLFLVCSLLAAAGGGGGEGKKSLTREKRNTNDLNNDSLNRSRRIEEDRGGEEQSVCIRNRTAPILPLR